MVITAGDNMYLVQGALSPGDPGGTYYGFMVVPVGYPGDGGGLPNLESDDIRALQESSEYYAMDVASVRTAILAALKGVFDNQTYAVDGGGSITIVNPTITQVSQTQADVTPS